MQISNVNQLICCLWNARRRVTGIKKDDVETIIQREFQFKG